MSCRPPLRGALCAASVPLLSEHRAPRSTGGLGAALPLASAAALMLLALLVGPACAQPTEASPTVPSDATPAAQPEQPKAEPGSAEKAPKRLRYLLGAALIDSAAYPGAAEHDSKLRPFFAVQYGRFRLSTSRGNALLAFGGDTQGPGASAQLVQRTNLSVGASLRMDSGRAESDSPRLAGLGDVRPTLRGRLAVGWTPRRDWTLGAALSQDLIGRKGGAVGTLDLTRRGRWSEGTEWTAGFGMTLADAQNMRSYFGIDAAQSAASGLPQYTPSAGLRDAHAGVGLTTALGPRWLAFGTFGLARLQGDAAASPVALRRSDWSASVGLAYRCCER